MFFSPLAHWLLQNICFLSVPDFSGGLNGKIITISVYGDDDSKTVVDHSCWTCCNFVFIMCFHRFGFLSLSLSLSVATLHFSDIWAFSHSNFDVRIILGVDWVRLVVRPRMISIAVSSLKLLRNYYIFLFWVYNTTLQQHVQHYKIINALAHLQQDFSPLVFFAYFLRESRNLHTNHLFMKPAIKSN